MKDGQMETGMSDSSVPGPSWDPETGRAILLKTLATGNMNAILGFHPTSSEKIVATIILFYFFKFTKKCKFFFFSFCGYKMEV